MYHDTICLITNLITIITFLAILTNFPSFKLDRILSVLLFNRTKGFLQKIIPVCDSELFQ